MVVHDTTIPGVHTVQTDHFLDERGSVTKVFTEQAFIEKRLATTYDEVFFSVSAKNVIRGMHLQIAPAACSKLVFVTSGSVLDVVLDVRPHSPRFGQYVSFELSRANHTAVYVPEGCAHGFLAQEDNTCTVYLQTAMRDPAAEAGVRYDSFGMAWGIEHPIISKRDTELPLLADYSTYYSMA